MVRRSLLVLCGVGALLTVAAVAAEQHPPPAIFQLAAWPTVQLAAPSRAVTGLRLSALWAKNESVTGVDLALGRADSEGPMTGLGVSGWINGIQEEVTGLQAAGGGNMSGALYGCQAAGLGNAADEMMGIQVASLVNVASKTARGAQASAMVNMAESVTGLQVAGLGNQVEQMSGTGVPKVAGVQLAGMANLVLVEAEGKDEVAAEARMAGLQISGVGNRVDGQMIGLQAAGLRNTAKGDLYGVQLGALHDSARGVRGLQIGPINDCDDLRGVQIGLFNIRSGSWLPFVPLLNFRF